MEQKITYNCHMLHVTPYAYYGTRKSSVAPFGSEALKSSEAGKVSHALSAGSIVSAGELLARRTVNGSGGLQPGTGRFRGVAEM